MNRREFLKYQLQGMLWLAAGGSGLFRPHAVSAQTTPDVSIVKGDRAAATRAAVELLGGMQRFVNPGNRVIIKPNMSFARPPEAGTNTSPEVVRELAIMCKEAGAASILIPDNMLHLETACLDKNGIRDACASVDKNMVRAISNPHLFKEVVIPEAKDIPRTDIMKTVLQSDVLIAAPTAKSHSSAGVSLSMKGMMGLIYDRGVFHGRYDLDTSIVDLCTVLKADLAVIDASRVLSTGGPQGPGKVIRADTVIAAADMVAADATAVSLFEWYGRRFKPSQVNHIRLAHQRGLGRMDIEHLNSRRLSV
ncbi:MAG: DUF362 domain-containing protein [Desulfobacterales bacterium]|nr:DUF362 domain-containing protein [Desulfobacterales bacterium]